MDEDLAGSRFFHGKGEDFIEHRLLKYPEQDVPIWAVTEVLSFGSLAHLFDLMQTRTRDVARTFGVAHPSRFGAVLRQMVDIRNACAHGSRLFDRAFKRSLSLSGHHTDRPGSTVRRS